jgi:type IV pilus assembly protein PilY1
MKSVATLIKFKLSLKEQYLKAMFVFASLLFAAVASAATVSIASSPLVNSTTSQVLPNLMYILDNSGSMDWNFMPDYVGDGTGNICKTTNNSGAFSDSCSLGEPPFMANDFNGVYYNPSITYAPGLKSDGTEEDSMTAAKTANWTNVWVDGYGVQLRDQLNNATPSNRISLVPTTAKPYAVGYPDVAWCNKNNPTPAELFDPLICKQNSQYIFPSNDGTTNGSFNIPNIIRGYPYYYNISAGEYCTDTTLTTCTGSTVPVGAFTVPAKLRWCNSAARTNCQAKYIQNAFSFAKWSGVTTGAAPIGTIKINADTANGASPVDLSVTSITVNGISIIPAVPSPALTINDTTNLGKRTTLAANIAAAINAVVSAPTDFTATSSVDVVTIKPVGIVGAYTGNLNMTTSKYPQVPFVGSKAVGSLSITNSKAPATVSSIKVGNVDILGIPQSAIGVDSAASRNVLANLIVSQINGYPSVPDYKASSDGASFPTITITAINNGLSYNGSLSINKSTSGSGKLSISGLNNLAGGVDNVPQDKYTIPNVITDFSGGTPAVNTFNRVDIEPTRLSYPKEVTRTDCAGTTTCTYAEEMTNFANWYSYYRTRMQMMKSSTTRAFKLIDQRYRVGFITIANQGNAGNYLPIADFGNTQKANWYSTLKAISPVTNTPLLTGLATVGRIYSGKKPFGNSDPVQYSCQQNFALLTTDGYWNFGTAPGTQIDGTTNIGNMDGVGTGRPQFEGPTASAGSLADVAKYYFDTDLRTPGLNNCTGALGTNVCENNVAVSPTDNNVKQHMTTFTLGLGVDGNLGYTSDYLTATSGDFYDIKQGTKNWPVPVGGSQTAVDDLWHAAVNGQGQYFSAKNPNTLNQSLNDTLQQIGSKIGAGAAAASSTLNPVQGDNFAYISSYSTVKWTGNLESREINTNSGEISDSAAWCVENVLPSTCPLPSAIQSEDIFGATVAYCVTPSSSAASCNNISGTLVGTDCKVEIALSCTGTMRSKVGPNLSNRNIYIRNGSSLTEFRYSNLTAAQQNYFNKPFVSSKLSQWSALTSAQQNIAFGENLVNYLRGESGYEDRSSNAPPSVPTDNRVFRFREATLGDSLESTPLFVGKPSLDYVDPNYGPITDPSSFKAQNASRLGIVYIGTNDGMLHAIDAATGDERWAYIPSMVIPKLHQLADRTYSTHHANFVNGDPTIADVCVANCNASGAGGAQWKSILIGGLNGGGNGYYALDVTNPTTPIFMWEFDQTNDSDLGVSYGRPHITKKADGTWVVMITAGYNNIGDSTAVPPIAASNPGKGILYVLNPVNGQIVSKYNTGVGDISTPSGLSKITGASLSPSTNNSDVYVYGGDLLGNIWRFDINQPAAIGSNPFKMAELKDAGGKPQPITTAPEIALVGSKRLIVVGTGKYLELSDLTDTSQQSIYAITDSDSIPPVTLVNVRGSLAKQTLLDVGGFRTIQQPAASPNYATQRGWYVDLPDLGERVNILPQISGNALIVGSTVPSNTICSPGGYGWVNFFDYETGADLPPDPDNPSSVANLAGIKQNAPPVGINIFTVDNKTVTDVTTANNTTPQKVNVPVGRPSSGFQDHRVIWRELIDK